jgi:hypothetical protein
MFLALLFTILGGSISGLLALGTAWAGAKRYMQRWFAKQLADAIPRDMGAAIVLARNHGGVYKTEWLVGILKDVISERTSVLDIAGGTHLDLLTYLVGLVRQINVYDGPVAFQFLREKSPMLIADDTKLKLVEGEVLVNTAPFTGQTFDLLILMDVLHRVAPQDQRKAIEDWVKLADPTGGHILIVVEEEPLTEVSQAGLIQGTFYRVHEHILRSYLAAEGVSVVATARFRDEFKVAYICRRGQVAISADTSAAKPD